MHKGRYPGSSADMAQHIIGGRYKENTDDSSSAATTTNSSLRTSSSTSSGFDLKEDLDEMDQIAKGLFVRMNAPEWKVIEEACQEM